MTRSISNPPPIRIIRGSYTSQAVPPLTTILSGTGFTLTRVAAGQMTITFIAPFSTVPTVVFSPQRADAAAANLGSIIGTPTTSAVQLLRATLTGAGEDGPMHFAAIQS